PPCLKAVLKDMETFLRQNDWDGVNVGELTFESLEGPDKPENFTPFNSAARREFQTLYSFDPLELFNPQSGHYWKGNPEGLQQFYSYRREANVRLMKTFLESLEGLKVKCLSHWVLFDTM